MPLTSLRLNLQQCLVSISAPGAFRKRWSQYSLPTPSSGSTRIEILIKTVSGLVIVSSRIEPHRTTLDLLRCYSRPTDNSFVMDHFISDGDFSYDELSKNWMKFQRITGTIQEISNNLPQFRSSKPLVQSTIPSQFFRCGTHSLVLLHVKQPSPQLLQSTSISISSEPTSGENTSNWATLNKSEFAEMMNRKKFTVRLRV